MNQLSRGKQALHLPSDGGGGVGDICHDESGGPVCELGLCLEGRD